MPDIILNDRPTGTAMARNQYGISLHDLRVMAGAAQQGRKGSNQQVAALDELLELVASDSAEVRQAAARARDRLDGMASEYRQIERDLEELARLMFPKQYRR